MINSLFMLDVFFYRLLVKLKNPAKWSDMAILGFANYQESISVGIVEVLWEEFPWVGANWSNLAWLLS